MVSTEVCSSKIGDLYRQTGISDNTFHRWKAKYGGLELSKVKRLKQLEDENRRLKQIVADLTLDKAALKDVLAKNGSGIRCTAGVTVLVATPMHIRDTFTPCRRNQQQYSLHHYPRRHS